MDLSIIIVSWRCLDYLRTCLTTVYRETSGLSLEVIVVDNASGDGSGKILQQEFPQIRFIQSEHNLGFARANNVGYRVSSGANLLFLNPDTEVVGDAIERMAAYLRANDPVGAVGARLLNTDGSLQTSCVQAYPTIWNQVLDSDFLRRRFPKWDTWGTQAFLSEKPSKVQVISGACLMVKREVFAQVELFTETYFMYGEDLDLNYKINTSGYEVHYLPHIRIVHHGGTSSSQRGTFFVPVRQRESIAQFLRSTRGLFYFTLYRLAVAFVAAVRMLLVVLSIPLGGKVFRNTDRQVVLGRWLANFRWALGLSDRSASPGET